MRSQLRERVVLFSAGVGLVCYNMCAFILVTIRFRACLCEVLAVDVMTKRYSVDADPLLGGLFSVFFGLGTLASAGKSRVPRSVS